MYLSLRAISRLPVFRSPGLNQPRAAGRAVRSSLVGRGVELERRRVPAVEDRLQKPFARLRRVALLAAAGDVRRDAPDLGGDARRRVALDERLAEVDRVHHLL